MTALGLDPPGVLRLNSVLEREEEAEFKGGLRVYRTGRRGQSWREILESLKQHICDDHREKRA